MQAQTANVVSFCTILFLSFEDVHWANEIVIGNLFDTSLALLAPIIVIIIVFLLLFVSVVCIIAFVTADQRPR